MTTMKLEERLRQSVEGWAGNVILRSDVASLGSASQLSVALGSLQRRGVLIRIGRGIYAKTRVSSVTGVAIPAGTLESLSEEALRRLGITISTSRAAAEYNAGRSTQMPGKLVVNTGKRRIRRSICVGGRCLFYENDDGVAPGRDQESLGAVPLVVPPWYSAVSGTANRGI